MRCAGRIYFRIMEARHIDLEYLERFCKGDQARMEKYARIYLEGAPGLFAQLEECLDTGNGEGLAVTAHTLRPQVNFMGAQSLLDLLTATEERARKTGAADCAELVGQARSLHEQVMTELRARFNRP